ncbi:MAG: aminotransferase [Flavobacteriaceae bacterium]|nr:aminotransferase [Flavobacteriaceae bacterium]|tara:strand:- start:2930 stop:3964 length:1035 start_codon:yes stop_codon:yes gene_type:complete
MKFPISKKYIYFDSARSGGMYQELLYWRKKHDNLFLNKGSQFRFNYDDFIEDVRNGVTDFFNSQNNFVFLTNSFSVGFNSLLSILNPNLKFLLIKDDYPSIIDKVRINRFKHDFVENTFDLEEKIIKKIEIFKPQVLAISIVQYLNGVYLNLDFFNKIKSKYPELLIIADGTQFCGTKSFDFNSSAIDILISSGYKWLYSGYGNGFLLIKKNFIRNFLKNSDIKNLEKFLSGTFEPGNLDTLSFGSLLFSINMISKYGIDKIEKKVNSLSNYAYKKFNVYNLLDYQTINRQRHSNIFNIKGNKLLYKKLIKNQIICSIRGSGIRVSFNFYNKKKEIDYLLKFFK